VIETSQPEAMQLAYEFGLRKSSDPKVLVMRVSDDTLRQLEIAGQLEKRAIAGVETSQETIFKPESFKVLNRDAQFPQIINPKRGN
jgi:hypothetical protein